MPTITTLRSKTYQHIYWYALYALTAIVMLCADGVHILLHKPYQFDSNWGNLLGSLFGFLFTYMMWRYSEFVYRTAVAVVFVTVNLVMLYKYFGTQSHYATAWDILMDLVFLGGTALLFFGANLGPKMQQYHHHDDL